MHHPSMNASSNLKGERGPPEVALKQVFLKYAILKELQYF